MAEILGLGMSQPPRKTWPWEKRWVGSRAGWSSVRGAGQPLDPRRPALADDAEDAQSQGHSNLYGLLRLAALNLEDARIAEGLRISLAAIRRMHERAAVGGVRLLVVLIPTKETVFRDLWQNPASSYRNLTENEERMWRTTKTFLERHGIEYLDALSALRARLAAGIQPYQVSIDGHPNEQGHGAIARLVAAHLASPGARGRGQ